MRLRLVVLQFPLLYCTGVLVGVSVYGVNFSLAGGWLYLIPLLVPPAVLPRLRPPALDLLRRSARPLAAVGVLLGAAAYRPMHLGFWDERSLAQAAAVCAFGVISSVVGWLALAHLAHHPARTPAPLAAALAAVAAVLALARWYPMITLLGAALCLAPAVALRWEDAEPPAREARRRTLFLGALSFYLAAELGEAAWDAGVDSAWGPLLAVALLTAAAAGLAWWFAAKRFAGVASHPWLAAGAGVAALAVAGTASALTAWRPALVLAPARHALLGLALGGLIVAVFARTAVPGAAAAGVQGVWLAFVLGLAVSAVYSAQFEAFPYGRLAFAAPAVAALAWEWRRAGGARRAEAAAAG